MLEKKEHQYEKAVLVGLITQHQDEEKLTEYLDELEFLAYTAGATVEKRITQKLSQSLIIKNKFKFCQTTTREPRDRTKSKNRKIHINKKYIYSHHL